MEQAVFKLISRYQQFEAVLREADEYDVPLDSTSTHQATPFKSCMILGSTQENNLQITTIDGCLSCIQAQSHISGTSVPIVAANECAKALAELLEGATSYNEAQKERFQCVIQLIKVLTSKQLLDRTHFIEQVGSKVGVLPLELLWQLHTCSAIPLDQFIERNVGCSGVLASFVNSVCALFSCTSSEEEHNIMKKGFLEVLVRCGYSQPDDLCNIDVRLVKASRMILDSVVLELLKLSTHDQHNKTEPETLAFNHLGNLFETVRCDIISVDRDTLSSFFMKQLQTILCFNPNSDVNLAVSKQHEHWTYAKSPQSMTKMFTQLLLSVNDKHIVSLLQQVIDDEQVNWQHTLIFVSVFYVCFRQGTSHIKGLVSSLLKDSLERCHVWHLYAAFLLARQAAAEGSSVFPSYSQWFQDQFNNVTSPHVVSSRTYMFFMDFLTGLVPYESVHYLKAHVQHPPHTPVKYQDILKDYISLAKTRLADFKESWQTGDMAGPSTGQIGNKLNIEDTVAAFDKTGCIPKRVLEYSIFGKPFYMGTFLPALLAPRVLPDIPDSKMKFIEALRSANKIPSAMYQKYAEACVYELKMLLEGVSSEDMDEISEEPIEHLRECLESLHDVIMTTSKQTLYHADIAGHISLISSRVTTVIKDINTTSANVRQEPRLITIGIDTIKTVEPTIMQVTDLLLGCYCKAHMLMIKSGISILHLTECFTAMLSSQWPLHYSLYHRLYTLFCYQGNTLSNDHLAGLSRLLVHMSILVKRLPLVKLRTHYKCREKHLHQEKPDYVPLLHLVCKEMQHHTGDSMKFALRLWTAVLACVPDDGTSRPDEHVIKCLKKKICYLRPRLDPGFRPEFISMLQLSSNVASSEIHHRPVPDEITFDEWLSMELRVKSCHDCLNVTLRKSYHHWILYMYYLPQLIASSGPENPTYPYKITCTIILNAVLDVYTEQSQTMGQDCPHVARQGQDHIAVHMCSCSEMCREMVQLLQELVLVWPAVTLQSTPSNDTGCPWLLAEFTKRLKKLSQSTTDLGQHSDVAMDVEVSNQVMLLQRLSPYLLFVDSLLNIPRCTDWTHLVYYINIHLREHVNTEFCSLSYEAVSVMSQGILLICTQLVHSSDSARLKDVGLIDKLLHQSPLLTVSFLKHWKMLGPIMTQLHTCSHQPSTLAILNELHSLCNQVCCNQSPSRLSSHDTVRRLGSSAASEQWFMMVVLVSSMSQLVERTNSVDELLKMERLMIRRVVEYFQKDIGCEDEMMQCLFECHIAQTAYYMLTSHPDGNQQIDKHCQAASIMLSKSPRYLKGCTCESMLKRDFLQQSTIRLYPIICFRILQSRSCENVLQQSCTDPQLLTVIMNLYTSLVKLHCHTNQPVAEFPSTTSGPQTLDLDFVQSCFSLLHGVITSSSHQTLAATELVNIDPEVRSMILQRL